MNAHLDLAAVRERHQQHQTLVDRWRRAGDSTDLPSARAAGIAIARAEVAAARDVGALLDALDAIRAEAPDPGLLRWCTWPDCWQHFNAATGPAGGGWKWACRQHALLCPQHCGAGHDPDFDYDSTLRTVTAHCECGDGEVMSPGNIQAVLAWWKQHIRDDVTSHTSTGT